MGEFWKTCQYNPYSSTLNIPLDPLAEAKRDLNTLALINRVAINSCWTPLKVAVIRNWPQVTEWMLQNGADPNLCPDGYPPIHMACINGRYEMIPMLIAYGGNARLLTLGGSTAIRLLEISSRDRDTNKARDAMIALLYHGAPRHQTEHLSETTLSLMRAREACLEASFSVACIARIHWGWDRALSTLIALEVWAERGEWMRDAEITRQKRGLSGFGLDCLLGKVTSPFAFDMDANRLKWSTLKSC
jgi:hypothetical protein